MVCFIPVDQVEGFETLKDSIFLTRNMVLAFTNRENLNLPLHSIQQRAVYKVVPQIKTRQALYV